MFEYFKLLESQAILDKNQYSICDLTKEIMQRAEYEKYDYVFKNGNIRQRIRYNKKFDDILIAKWLIFYKNLFISKLIKIPKLQEYQVDIINKTFYLVFYSLDINRLKNDNIINKYVNLTLNNRIGHYLFIMGSEKRLVQTNQGSTNMRLNTSINHLALHLDTNLLDINNTYTDSYFLNYSDVIIDLQEKLQYNKFGDRLIEAMLFSNKKIQLYDIENYLFLEKEEKTFENKKLILDAYNTICNYAQKYFNKPYKKYTLSCIHFK